MITATKLFVFLLLFLSSQSEYVLEGSKTSYLQFRRWPGGLDTGLEFQFRTGQQDTLILYTDDIINCIFLELKLVRGAVQLRYDFGLGPGVLRTTVQQYGDNNWHKVALNRGGLKSTLTVDSEIISQSINSSVLQSVEFSNTNMYIGGIPTWLAANSNDLSAPSVVFEPTFQGGFKDLVYKGRSGDSKQKLVAYKVI
ncbi:neurexin-2 [Eurytemora carolleeae]|uniref:neurexin-2 n=1 Tax=Eurytemora carolleeae TaxID=1294199 RepID=UPI000C757BC0|nr:neurexin-2 [Eurytemora carolleeae]|eukprot:XP_023347072.1 neurexin-2-like [Eurytemora affinis]